ncbi:hypothetical protein DVR12_26860 [Chitinophaga silvatica]|uniref:Uncharacterized protein n=1 Tax=Chitinophaga silvatica TaxID=2282649 RepID=A0A3E1Y2C0_9BACT|nr:hypothetical protein DVR12_26860 [Chitinophaga silvatica]
MKNVHYQKDGLFLHIPIPNSKSIILGLVNSIICAVWFRKGQSNAIQIRLKKKNYFSPGTFIHAHLANVLL